MSKVAIITMVQGRDLPHALCSLASAAAARRPNDIHLILVNDVCDAALSADLERASGAEIIEAGENLGVAGGRNRLLREAIARGAEFVLSIDDDIIVPPDFIDALEADFAALRREGKNPGILTPATLDFHAVAPAIFSDAEIESIHRGEAVSTPASPVLRNALAGRDKKRARDIYHMGIADWRGAYLYAGGAEERRIQAAYGVSAQKSSGDEAHLRHAKLAWTWILNGAGPQPVDTAPGGICFYPTSLAADAGFHDERFNPFGFEDADFALRTGRLGFRHFCAPRAVAIHDIASRLSDRPVAVLRATQGKMAGAFARKHVTGRESAAALAAIARRTVNLATSREFSRREEGMALKAPSRLASLMAFFAHALLASAPARGEILAGPLFERVRTLVRRAVPHLEVLHERSRAGEFVLESADGAMSIAVRDDAEGVMIAAAGLSMPRDLAPELFAAATPAPALRFDFSARIIDAPGGTITVDEIDFTIASAVRISGRIQFERGARDRFGIEPMRIDVAGLTIRDGGVAARIVRLLAEVDRLSPAAFLEAAMHDRSESVRAFLSGDADAIRFDGSATIAGEPGQVAWAGAFETVAGAAANVSMQALFRDDAPPSAPTETVVSPAAEPETEMTSIISKILREDPSVAPFPDAYSPPKSLRVARRLRYYAASKGLPLTPNEGKLVSFRNRNRGERAFIIGNGPSLNLVDLTKLKDETTFGVNAIYLNREKMGFLPTHHIVEDVFVAEDRADEINALRGPHKWYGHYLRYCLKPTPEVCWLNVACDYRNYRGFPHFSTNAARIVWVGGTVSYIALQLAYHMGFDEVYLVGFDHSYSIPKEAKVEGRAITSTSDDPNHFHPGYFGKGYRWHDPRVDRMEKAYINARAAYEEAGRKVYNATVGGHLEVFERVAFGSLFK